jgi:ribosomal protein L5
MNIAVCTSATNNDDARELLAGFGFPFKRDNDDDTK